MNQEFFRQFRNEQMRNKTNPTGGIMRTPLANKPMNANPIQHEQYKEHKKEENRKKRENMRNKRRTVRERFTNSNNVDKGLIDHLIDVAAVATVYFLLSTKTAEDILSRFIPGFHEEVCEHMSFMQQRQQQYGPHWMIPQNGIGEKPYVVKSSRVVSMKGKVIKMILVIVLCVLVKSWMSGK